MPAAALTNTRPIALPTLNRLGAVALVLLGVGLCRVAATTPDAWQRNDFAHYYLSARALLDGVNPYTATLAELCEGCGFEFDPRITAGTNPPALTLLVSGVAWLPPWPAYVLWTTLQTTCLAGLLAALMRQTSRTPGETWQWLLAGVVLCTTAVWSHFHYSQVQLLVAMLIATACSLKAMGRGSAAAGAITVAAALKVFPAALLPWFVLSGPGGWHGVRRRALVAAGVGLAIFVLTGPLSWYYFLTHGIATIQQSVVGSTSNYSLQSVATMVIGAALGRPLPEEMLQRVLLVSRVLACCGLAAGYLAIWLGRLDDRRAITLLTIAMILASPVCWSHYFVLLIPPVWLACADVHARPQSITAWLVALVGLVCLSPEMDAIVPMGQMGVARTVLHFYPIVALLAFAALTLILSPRRAAGG